MSRTVFLSPRAFKEIKFCIAEAEDQYEVGGLLIGYKIGLDVIVIRTVKADGCNSRFSVEIGGEKQSKCARRIIESYWPLKPKLIGVWHYHIYNNRHFSKKDIESTKLVSKILRGAVSILATKDEKNRIVLSAMLCNEKGKVYGKTQ